MGGKGKKRYESYSVCACAQCTYRDKQGFPSWSYYSTGPDECRHCGTPFRFPAWVAKQRSSNRKGHAEEGDWKVYNSKGRVRPSPSNAESRNNHKEKDKEKEVSQEAFAQMCKEKLKDEPDFEPFLRMVEQKFPPKPKEPKQELQEAMELMEKAKSMASHQAKMAKQMQDAYLKKADELLEYKNKLEAQKRKCEEANAAINEARMALTNVQAKAAAEHGPFVAVLQQEPGQLLANYNPTQGIADAIAAVPGIEQVPWDITQSFQGAMHSVLRDHLQKALAQMRVAPSVQAALCGVPTDFPHAFPDTALAANASGNAGNAAPPLTPSPLSASSPATAANVEMSVGIGGRRNRDQFEQDHDHDVEEVKDDGFRVLSPEERILQAEDAARSAINDRDSAGAANGQ